MRTKLSLEILPQPDDTTCGATCLHAVYKYHGDRIPLAQVIDEVEHLETGGTLAVLLGRHALARGYDVALYTYNLNHFDPTWFGPGAPDLAAKLRAQAAAKTKPKLQHATRAYLKFLADGGDIRFRDLTPQLIRTYLQKNVPLLTGLSSTYLYREAREYGSHDDPDDIRGKPQGHFVVLCGYDGESRQVLLADPYSDNPFASEQYYEVSIDRLICAIMLGIVTYDANIMVIEPRKTKK